MPCQTWPNFDAGSQGVKITKQMGGAASGMNDTSSFKKH